jgi:hypothetical protein
MNNGTKVRLLIVADEMAQMQAQRDTYNVTRTSLNPEAKIIPPRAPRRFRQRPSHCSA